MTRIEGREPSRRGREGILMTDKEWIVACKKCGAADSVPTTAFRAYNIVKHGATHGNGCGGELEAKHV